MYQQCLPKELHNVDLCLQYGHSYIRIRCVISSSYSNVPLYKSLAGISPINGLTVITIYKYYCVTQSLNKINPDTITLLGFIHFDSNWP